jgi:hypothetical protein
MPWPSSNVDTTHMDAAGDDPSQARAEIKKMADNVNAIKDMRGVAEGVASLDAGGQVPAAQLPTIAANRGGTGQTAYTVGDILYASATGTLTKLSAGTNGYVLKSNGPGVAPSWQQEGGGLTSGTRMLFQNSAAPTGWTKETNSAYNNVALRIVTGTVSNGGADDFTTVFGASKTTASHELTVAQMPLHNHALRAELGGSGTGSNRHMEVRVNANTVPGTTAILESTANAGTGGGHSHGLTMDLKYRDFIIAQKD